MKRGYILYLAVLLPVLLIGFLIVRGMTSGPHERALGKLGKSQREFREASDLLVLGAGDPTAVIVEYVTNPRRTTREREHALRILQQLPRHRSLPDIGAQLVPLLNHGSDDFRMVVLETLEKIESVAAAPAVVKIFRERGDTALFQAAHRALRAASVRLMKRIDSAVREDDTVRIDSCFALASRIPSGRGPVYVRLARYYESRGDSARAAACRRQAGLLDTCWVVGPFDNAGTGALTRPYGPETRPFSPLDTFHVGDEDLARWMKSSHLNDKGEVDFSKFFVKQGGGVAYLFTYLHVPADRDVLLYLAYHEPSAVWLNDTLIHRKTVYRAAQGDDDVEPVRLHKGSNALLIKSVSDLASWRVQARVTDLNGDAMPDVRFSWGGAGGESIVDAAKK
jgi:hypothetical protein